MTPRARELMQKLFEEFALAEEQNERIDRPDVLAFEGPGKIAAGERTTLVAKTQRAFEPRRLVILTSEVCAASLELFGIGQMPQIIGPLPLQLFGPEGIPLRVRSSGIIPGIDASVTIRGVQGQAFVWALLLGQERDMS